MGGQRGRRCVIKGGRTNGRPGDVIPGSRSLGGSLALLAPGNARSTLLPSSVLRRVESERLGAAGVRCATTWGLTLHSGQQVRLQGWNLQWLCPTPHLFVQFE